MDSSSPLHPSSPLWSSVERQCLDIDASEIDIFVSQKKVEGSVALPGRRPKNRATKRGHRPKKRHSTSEMSNGLGVLFPPCPGCPCRGPSGLGSLVLLARSPFVPVCVFCSLSWPVVLSFFFFLCRATSQKPIRSIRWPWASRSSSRRERRQVKSEGTDPRTGVFRCVFDYVPLVHTNGAIVPASYLRNDVFLEEEVVELNIPTFVYRVHCPY